MDDTQDYRNAEQVYGDDPGFSSDLGPDNQNAEQVYGDDPGFSSDLGSDYQYDQGYESYEGYYEDQGQAYQYESQDQGYEGDAGYYQDESVYPEYYDQEPWWEDSRIASVLMWLTYAVGAGGVALGIYGSASEGAYQGLHLAVPLMVGAAGIISFIRYSIFHRSDAIRLDEDPDESSFQIEIGFINLAVGIMALVIFFGSWGTAAEVALTFSYAVFLALSLVFFTFRNIAQESMDLNISVHALVMLILVGFMFFFCLTAAGPANLTPF